MQMGPGAGLDGGGELQPIAVGQDQARAAAARQSQGPLHQLRCQRGQLRLAGQGPGARQEQARIRLRRLR
ncbi:MAG: hypothetical protein U5R48_08005 [Gammaproteobacteria bacterium]|nr:hypothetical protein [Gammaproteobacteria bacterium]